MNLGEWKKGCKIHKQVVKLKWGIELGAQDRPVPNDLNGSCFFSSVFIRMSSREDILDSEFYVKASA